VKQSPPTTPVPRKLILTIAQFTAPPVLSLMVVAHILDREEYLWMQMTNALKGTLPSQIQQAPLCGTNQYLFLRRLQQPILILFPVQVILTFILSPDFQVQK
jgi:hypothetical protein